MDEQADQEGRLSGIRGCDVFPGGEFVGGIELFSHNNAPVISIKKNLV